MQENNKGDEKGRRISQRKALLLSEAGVAAQALLILLRKAGHENNSVEVQLGSSIEALLGSLKHAENAQLNRSYGRLDSRTKYSGLSSHPLLEVTTRDNLFIDESGKSFPEPHLPQSFFSLGSVSLSDAAVENYRIRADEIKTEFFDRTDVTFHEPYMRAFDGIYYFGGDETRQAEFDVAIDELVAQTEFVAFGVGIRKTAFESDFVSTGIDPYLPTDAYELAIIMLGERYVDYLANSESRLLGRITFESQGAREDAEHQWSVARLLLDGTQWLPESVFRNWIAPGVEFIPKRGSDPTELADMFSRDLFEWIRGDCKPEVQPKRWSIFNQKIYCRADGLRGKFGLKVFPDSDIREQIMEHRRDCGATEI